MEPAEIRATSICYKLSGLKVYELLIIHIRYAALQKIIFIQVKVKILNKDLQTMLPTGACGS